MISRIKKFQKKQLIFHAALLLLSVACIIAITLIVKSQISQQAAERYTGDNEIPFSQISVFLNTEAALDKTKINSFRTTVLEELKKQLGDEDAVFIDAFSCTGTVLVSSDKTRSEVTATAVEGDFFAFHPFQLVSGSYITSDDKDINRVVIDEQTAWLLFGGYDLDNMEISINGKIHYIAGVIKHDEDYSSKKADGEAMRIFMTYRAYTNVYQLNQTDANTEEAGDKKTDEQVVPPPVTCYEIVLPNPVKNYAYGLMQLKFPIKKCEMIQNTGRFSFGKLVSLMKDPAIRVIASSGIAYPFWENAARYAESKAGGLLTIAMLLLVIPIIAFLVYTSKGVVFTYKKVNNELRPEWENKASEYIRKQQRIRWEKKNGITHESETFQPDEPVTDGSEVSDSNSTEEDKLPPEDVF